MEQSNKCPQCNARETPILIVRGPSGSPDGVSLKCRRCRHEWAHTQSDLRRVS